jgi:hypothetical protein
MRLQNTMNCDCQFHAASIPGCPNKETPPANRKRR